uniref:HMG box domain-containing protein n=1 Tax=Glossina pallidipes TaxID=7398 RepID=A0A1A9ZHR2_GLOPL
MKNKSICAVNPADSFGDILRMVGNEWKNLPASVKQNWEDRASRINEESAARRELDETLNCSSPNNEQETSLKIQLRTAQANDSEYVCLWRSCIRVRKNMQASDSVAP